MKPKPFEIIVEFTPQSTKTGITYEAHKNGSLTRCKDCASFDAERWWCSRIGIGIVHNEKSFCSWAEPKEAD